MVQSSPYTRALLRRPGINFREGITTSEWEAPDYRLALQQHRHLSDTLSACGIQVLSMEADVSHPDCPFVADTALVTRTSSVIMRMAEASREQETESVAALLSTFFPVRHVLAGRVQGGDVVQIGNRFVIGVTRHSNQIGAEHLAALLQAEGYEAMIVRVQLPGFLRDHVTWLGEERLLLHPALASLPPFAGYAYFFPGDGELHGTAALRIGQRLLLPEGCPLLGLQMEEAGFEVSHIPITEFRKMDGSLPGLTLLW
ncbi:MAG: hypothetical protein EAZ89_00965 [Bacteroidetes bacterium]|nr:MAG: hypothetical protein EAZ89_00965 [Bacteroidota bacterium]